MVFSQNMLSELVIIFRNLATIFGDLVTIRIEFDTIFGKCVSVFHFETSFQNSGVWTIMAIRVLEQILS